jgi:hypothetical protein
MLAIVAGLGWRALLVMGVALEMARAALRLADRTDPITEILAKRIIALAKEGMIDPNLLCEWGT